MEDFAKLTDLQLLPLISGGSSDAFRIVYERHQPKVYSRALFLLRSEALAEDVVQEVMLKLWLGAGRLNSDTNLTAYLRTLTSNQSFQVLRRQVLETRTSLERGEDWTEAHNETEEQILLDDARKVLWAGIALLPPQQRRVYELCHQQGLKYEEAARVLGLSKETVKSYMKLALAFLRRYVSAHTPMAVVLILFRLL